MPKRLAVKGEAPVRDRAGGVPGPAPVDGGQGGDGFLVARARQERACAPEGVAPLSPGRRRA
ncbi:hypothetical protein, partial [Achromobacter ruhlandii]|uniref:hypothetical protein n=1 Tax=Achromobacter ruhlandii TaxID=72557 RepID=UPI0021F16293